VTIPAEIHAPHGTALDRERDARAVAVWRPRAAHDARAKDVEHGHLNRLFAILTCTPRWRVHELRHRDVARDAGQVVGLLLRQPFRRERKSIIS
jgi:hypothetical protein